MQFCQRTLECTQAGFVCEEPVSTVDSGPAPLMVCNPPHVVENIEGVREDAAIEEASTSYAGGDEERD